MCVCVCVSVCAGRHCIANLLQLSSTTSNSFPFSTINQFVCKANRTTITQMNELTCPVWVISLTETVYRSQSKAPLRTKWPNDRFACLSWTVIYTAVYSNCMSLELLNHWVVYVHSIPNGSSHQLVNFSLRTRKSNYRTGHSEPTRI